MNFSEVVKIALSAIKANKLRSALTLLGIVVGVFSIIGVMTAVRVLQHSIESGMSQLGSHTFQIQRMPNMSSHAEWMRAMKRKPIELEHLKTMKERMKLAKYVAIEAGTFGATVQSGALKTNPNVYVAAEEPEGLPTNNYIVNEGRGLDDNDLRRSSDVCILGDEVVKKLFPRGGAVGSEVKVNSKRYTVIGTLEPKGASLGGSSDNLVIIPLTTFLADYGKTRDLHLMVKAASPEVYDDCMEEARMLLRTLRKVPPGEEDDFYIFSNESMIATFNDFTKYVKLGVGFISFISLLAAGVGIMNIMLVSVTERTKEIGIRKSIGAQKRSILSQFVTEAVVLCQIGGIVGILIGILAGNIAAVAFSVPPVFPADWALIGFVLCAFIGVVFGVYPAWKAANLDPIEALRYE